MRLLMLNKSILTVLIFFLFVIDNFSAQSVQVFMKGRVFDELSGSPISVNMEFRTSNGKKIKIQSNSITGAYEQIFNAGDTIEVILTNWDIARKAETIIIENFQKYTEVERNFYVIKFTPGSTVFSINAFNPAESDVLQVFSSKLEEINKMLVFNRNVKFEILISAKDTYKKEYKIVKEKIIDKSKKKKKDAKEQFLEKIVEVQNFSNEELKSLVAKRAQNMKSFLQKNGKFLERITIKEDYTPGTSMDKSGTKHSEMSVLIIVSEIKNALN